MHSSHRQTGHNPPILPLFPFSRGREVKGIFVVVEDEHLRVTGVTHGRMSCIHAIYT